MNSHTHISYRPDIDGLRAIAVSLVVLHHTFPDALKGGFIGVDIFFVISGYLISSILLNDFTEGSFSFFVFYKRRINRIFPALALVLASCFIYSWLTLLPNDLKQLGKHISAGAGFVSNLVFWSESGYFDNASKIKPLLHLWSLGVEEQFYIFWPIFIYLFYKYKLNLLKSSILLLSISFLYNVYIVKSNPTAAFFSPLSRTWELMLGALIAYNSISTQKNYFTKNNQTILSWIGLIFITYGAYTINPLSRFPGFWAILPVLGASFIILAGPNAWFNKYILSSRLLVLLGLISYPLYLWHWPILVFLDFHFNGITKPYFKIVAIFTSIGLSWFTFKYVELSVRKLSNYKYITPLLVTIMFAIFATGAYTFLRNGFDFRFPKIINAITNNKIDLHEGWRLHSCILDISNKPTDFRDECIEKNKSPLLFLWGDSHIAALYPGFKALQEEGKINFGIAQRTAAICPPILNYERSDNVGKWCNEINQSNFRLITALKPRIVVLYAYWAYGIDSNGNLGGSYELNKLKDTISALRSAGTKKIVILGPTPYWTNTLPDNILKFWKSTNSISAPPLYMSYGLDPKLKMYNDVMKRFSEENQLTYIDSLSYLCNESGCKTRDSEGSMKISSIDYGHLTVPAATDFVKRISSVLFQEK